MSPCIPRYADLAISHPRTVYVETASFFFLPPSLEQNPKCIPAGERGFNLLSVHSYTMQCVCNHSVMSTLLTTKYEYHFKGHEQYVCAASLLKLYTHFSHRLHPFSSYTPDTIHTETSTGAREYHTQAYLYAYLSKILNENLL